MPVVYALLAGETNLAVDDALLEVLPELAAPEQEAALDVLLARQRETGLLGLVAGFPSFDPSLQQRVLARTPGLYAGTRLAVDDERPDVRHAAIDLIRQSGDCRLAYLLADMLCSATADRETRQRAAAALNHITARHVEQQTRTRPDPAERREWTARGDYLARALRRAIEGWELHFRPEVLVAAMWLSDHLAEPLLEKASSMRSRLGRALLEQLRNPRDPRLAAFTLRALASPDLRSEVARQIGACRNTTFARALARQAWLLGDPQIARSCQRIRSLAWLEEGADSGDPAAVPSPGEWAGLVRLVAACGLNSERRLGIYGHLLATGEEAAQEAAFWQVAAEHNEEATRLLRSLVRSRDPAWADLPAAAARELRRRERDAQLAPIKEPDLPPAPPATPAEWFEHLWLRFEQMDEPERRAAVDMIPQHRAAFTPRVTAGLRSADPAERLKALQVARHLDLTAAVDTEIYRLANDADARVRSAAVAALGGLGGPVAGRIIRRGLEDPDPRVQSNAIEAAHRLDLPATPDALTPKLEADHHRVRATAVAALLQMNVQPAGEALLDMLEDPSALRRIAALWVVQRLNLASLLDRLYTLAENDPDTRVRHRAARVLRSLADDGLLPMPDSLEETTP